MSLTLGGRDVSYSELSDEADKYNYKPENRIFQLLLVEVNIFPLFSTERRIFRALVRNCLRFENILGLCLYSWGNKYLFWLLLNLYNTSSLPPNLYSIQLGFQWKLCIVALNTPCIQLPTCWAEMNTKWQWAPSCVAKNATNEQCTVTMKQWTMAPHLVYRESPLALRLQLWCF